MELRKKVKSDAILEDINRPKFLGSLTVGDTGEETFGPFKLTWKINIDTISWTLSKDGILNDSRIGGNLKYVGWNRIHINSEIDLSFKEFEIYVHEWPLFKEAMDFLYYDLGAKAATGTYEKSFVNPENLIKGVL